MPGIVSAAGLVGFLSEPDTELQVFALQTANDSMSLMWTEFAGAVGQMLVVPLLARHRPRALLTPSQRSAL